MTLIKVSEKQKNKHPPYTMSSHAPKTATTRSGRAHSQDSDAQAEPGSLELEPIGQVRTLAALSGSQTRKRIIFFSLKAASARQRKAKTKELRPGSKATARGSVPPKLSPAPPRDPATTSLAKKPKPCGIGPRGLGSGGPRPGTMRRAAERFGSPSNLHARISDNSWPRHR